jgi:aryl-alcohol dehydrogenase-like predicted oxidoreductase
MYRQLGRTGECVSAIGLGGFHVGAPKLSDAESIRLIRSAVDGGITFMDNCWDYNQGQSEIRMGEALKDGYRQKVFLMSKLDGRTKEEAATQLDESLRRLQTDHLDLIQHHEVIRFEDPNRIFAPQAAPWKQCWRPSVPAKSATSILRATKTRTSISTCSRLQNRTVFSSTPFRCR